MVASCVGEGLRPEAGYCRLPCLGVAACDVPLGISSKIETLHSALAQLSQRGVMGKTFTTYIETVDE